MIPIKDYDVEIDPDIDPTVLLVTKAIAHRSQATRKAYLQQIETMRARAPRQKRLTCANLAHWLAAAPAAERSQALSEERASNIAIISAYNDIVSAHAPYQGYPELIKRQARKNGASAQVAAGVPAMCDGVTQGASGMELSLMSRDVIAMGVAIALSHDVFDAGMLLGVCDKIVPGLLIGALHFGHLPFVFVPSGPMPSGVSNQEKAKIRQEAAQGRVDRKALLACEMAAYHAPGTCTFYGTANSNQMLLQAMGLQLPGAAFVPPGAPLREALTLAAVDAVLEQNAPPIGQVVDARSIVNALVALLATGGSTNHLIHWVAVARAAGIIIDWSDASRLSAVTPLLARVYPNGSADVNAFEDAGGPSFVIDQLLKTRLLHPNALTLTPGGLKDQTLKPALEDNGRLAWRALPDRDFRRLSDSPDETQTTTQPFDALRSASAPFSANGGIKLLTGNLGRSLVKVSAVPEENWIIEAKARVFASQSEVLRAFERGEFKSNVICVVRWQGPRANGMPELHALTPTLAALQSRGLKVALVTDGRMSGASGQILAAIHLTPEGLLGGPIAKLRDGDLLRLDARAGALDALVEPEEWAARDLAQMPPELAKEAATGMGRELFASLRRNALSAEEGACTWL